MTDRTLGTSNLSFAADVPFDALNGEQQRAVLRANYLKRRFAGETPAPEEYLETYPQIRERKELLWELLSLELSLCDAAAHAQLLKDYLERFPQCRAELEQFLPGGEDGAPGLSLLSVSAIQLDPPTNASALNAHTVAGYQIEGELGRGGMGVVYKARQAGLNRPVALKMILRGDHAGRGELDRFHLEAKTIASLDHVNIVKIYEVGEHQGKPFFSLELVRGGALSAKLNGAPMPLREAAKLIETLARAIHVAHLRNVIHRDLKPANVLLTEDGTPKITDFGLAKRTDLTGNTRIGAIMGTPCYMAPEQAMGMTDKIGPAADVYALGAILYECITGHPPFQGPSVMAVVAQVIHQPLLAPSHVRPGVPKDLESICVKCLKKRENERYESALALAKDLRRFLSGEPIRARPITRVAKAWRWCRRHPAVASLLATVMVILLAGSAVSVYFAVEARRKALGEQRERKNAQRLADNEKRLKKEALASAWWQRQLATREVLARRAAEQAQATADRRAAAERNAKEIADRERERFLHQLYLADVRLAHADWESGSFDRMRESLQAHGSARKYEEDLRGFEWYYLNRLAHWPLLNLTGHTKIVMSAAFSPDGKRIVSGGGDRLVKVWDARTGGEALSLKGHGGPVDSVAFSRDGKRIVSGSFDTTVKVWDATTGQIMRTLKGHTGPVYCAVFDLDGKRIASSGDETICVWDASTGQRALTLKGHTQPVNSIAFSRDGKRIVSASYDKTVRVFNASTGRVVSTMRGHTGPVYCAAFDPDGKRIVSASYDKTVRVWDASTASEILTLRGHSENVYGAAFSPNGERIVSASSDKTVKVWDASTGEVLLSLKGHAGGVSTTAFSPDGKRIVSASADGTLKLWDSEQSQEGGMLKVPVGFVGCADFSPDGKRIACGGGEFGIWGGVTVWDAVNRKAALTIKGHQDYVWSVSVSPDGKRIASGSSDSTVKVWDADTGREVLSLTGHGDLVASVAFSTDGKRIASGSHDKTVRVWDAVTGREMLSLDGHSDLVTCVAYSPNGQRIVSASRDKTVKLWDATTGRVALTLKGHVDDVLCTAFGCDPKRLVTGSRDKTVKVWDASTGNAVMTLHGHTGPVSSVRFSPDGRRIVSGSRDKTVRLWDASTGRETLTLRGHSVGCAAFSPDGKRLVSAGGTITVWDASK